MNPTVRAILRRRLGRAVPSNTERIIGIQLILNLKSALSPWTLPLAGAGLFLALFLLDFASLINHTAAFGIMGALCLASTVVTVFKPDAREAHHRAILPLTLFLVGTVLGIVAAGVVVPVFIAVLNIGAVMGGWWLLMRGHSIFTVGSVWLLVMMADFGLYVALHP